VVLTVGVSNSNYEDDLVIEDILLNGVALTLTTDYTVAGFEITVLKAALAGLTEGTSTITVTTTKLGNIDFALEVEDTTPAG